MIQVDLDRIRTLEAKGMSLRAIGKELGVSHQTVYNRLRKEGVGLPSRTQRE